MKAKDLYNMKPQKIDKCLGHLSGYRYDHVQELTAITGVDSYYGLEEKNEKVEIRYYADYCIDGRRTWTLASVWFDNQPVMVIQNAGREGDDHAERGITDVNRYKEMIEYIQTLIDLEKDDMEISDVMDAEEEYEGLDAFYGYRLSDLYNPNFEPKYKEGDIVTAKVAVSKQYGYIFEDTEMIEKKIKILNVDKVNPHDTYRAEELERHRVSYQDNDGNTLYKIEDIQKGAKGETIYGRFNADLIQIS